MTIVAFGDYEAPVSHRANEVLKQRQVVFASNGEELRKQLARARCVVVRSHAQLREVAPVLRGSRPQPFVPMMALVERVSPRELLELHAAGADDVVLLDDLEGLERRLQRVAQAKPEPGGPRLRGSCLLAHANSAQLTLFARVLEAAGLEVDCASDTESALAALNDSPPNVAVVSSALPPEGGRRALRRMGAAHVPSILLSTGNPSAFSPQGWAVVSEDAPADELLFVVNDLLNPQEFKGRRASRRLPYATLCAFRCAGELAPRLGLTYNLGREGIYIRTLDAPPVGAKVWLELSPPGTSELVHVRGQVAWARAPSIGARIAPPGFGVLLDAQRSPAEDFALLCTKYDWMLGVITSSEL